MSLLNLFMINENCICSFFLIIHLTYCMQQLNVKEFQFYKYWHDVIIQNAFAKFNIEYLIIQFYHNLIKIQNNIFKNLLYDSLLQNLICDSSMKKYALINFENFSWEKTSKKIIKKINYFFQYFFLHYFCFTYNLRLLKILNKAYFNNYAKFKTTRNKII